MQHLFSISFDRAETDESIAPIQQALPEIDKHIAAAAPEWPLEKISKIDLAVLRLAVWELLFEKDAPPKVVIDEAVELGKSFGNEHSGQFINGVLGTIAKTRIS